MKTKLTILLLTVTLSLTAQVNPKKWNRQNKPYKYILIENPEAQLPMNTQAFKSHRNKSIAMGVVGVATAFCSPFIGTSVVVLDLWAYTRSKKGKGKFLNNHKICKR